MKKNILVALFLAVILFVGSNAFILLFSYQAAEKLKQSVGQELAVTYSWISLELDGEIVFHDVSITPYRLKRTFYIDRLKLSYGDYFNLLLNLSNLTAGKHYGLQQLSATSIKGVLEGRDFEEWLALEYGEDFSKPMGLYSCGDQTRVSHNNLRHMGVHEYNASLTLKKMESVQSDAFGLSIMLDRGPLGDTTLNTSWEAFSIPDDLSLWDISKFKLNNLSVTHVDNGYFRRLSNFCSQTTGFDRAQFSDEAAKQWQQSLSSMGLEASTGVRALYRDYLLQGGQLKLKMSPAKPFVLDRFKQLLDEDLISYFGISASLNGVSMLPSKLTVNGQHYNPPVIAVIEKVVEEPKPKTGYIAISLDTLEQTVQQKVRVVLVDGKKYEGRVISVNENKIELNQLLAGGSVAYSLQRDQISSFEMWH